MQESHILLRTDSIEFSQIIDDVEFVEICLYNSAYIYETSDNKFLLVSKIGSKYALLYNTREDLDLHIDNKYFPVPVDDNIFGSESDNFKNIADSICIYENHINEKFNFFFDDKKTIYHNLIELENIVNSYDTLSEYDVISIGIYSSELFARKHNLYWESNLLFTFNPTWYPIIKDSTGKQYDILGRLIESYTDTKQVLIKHNYLRALAYFKNIRPVSDEYLQILKLPDDSDL